MYPPPLLTDAVAVTGEEGAPPEGERPRRAAAAALCIICDMFSPCRICTVYLIESGTVFSR